MFNIKLTLYHNTTNENAIKINKEGIIPGKRLSVYGKGSEAEGSGIWCSTVRGYGYGGATITFEVEDNDESVQQQNDTEYMVFRTIQPKEIVDIDLQISTITSTGPHNTMESDIPQAINKHGKNKVLQVFKKHENKFIKPYNYDLFLSLVETGNKYCKGIIKLKESCDISKMYENNIPKKYKHMVKDFYKTPTGTWMIDLADGYITSYGTNYIENKYKKDCIYELENAVSKDLTESLDDQSIYLRTFEKSNPKYTGRITSIKLGTTRKGEKKLTFNLDDKSVLVLEYPKKSKPYYYYVNGEPQGHIASVAHILEKLIESKQKMEEASRNELLAKTKGETISRYKRAEGYKGFNIVSIDTSDLLKGNTLIVTCRVGKYDDVIQLEDVLYWIQICAEENSTNQINTKVITKALSNSIDGMDIKVDCECGDWVYRMAYQATEWGYKYGKPETRPAKITNPNGFGALCKHLTAMLSNKKWMQQVSGTVMDWCVKNIEQINEFVKPKEGKELTLPNELARQNAKAGFYTKLFKDKLDDEKEEPEKEIDNTDTQEDKEDFEELADVENTNKEDENEQ